VAGWPLMRSWKPGGVVFFGWEPGVLVFCAVAIPDHGEFVAVVGQAVEAEPIPLGLGQEGVDDEFGVVAGADANEVAKGGVVGVLSAFLDPFFLGIAFRVFAALDEHGSGDSIVGVGGGIFIDPGNDLAVLALKAMGFCIGLQGRVEDLFGDGLLIGVVD